MPTSDRVSRTNLARAFLKDAPILLRDEPTSPLVVEGESQVVARLPVLEKGLIRESGAPGDLLKACEYYARVVSGRMQTERERG